MATTTAKKAAKKTTAKSGKAPAAKPKKAAKASAMESCCGATASSCSAPTATSAASSAAVASRNATGAVGIKGFARAILYVKDWEPALRFYRDVLGLPLAYPAETGWAEFALGGTALCIHGGRSASAGANTDGICSIGLAVDDFDGARTRLKAKGVAVGEPFSPCGGLRVAHFHDPDGNGVAIEGV